jgi:hypothetical protein
MWIATTHSNGVLHAPEVGVTGGSFLGAPLFVSSGVTSTVLALVDGAKVAGGLGEVEVSHSNQALVQSDTAPTGGISGSPASLTGLGQGQPSAMISLWQQNATGIRAAQFFGCVKLRTNAVAAVSLAGSPA